MDIHIDPTDRSVKILIVEDDDYSRTVINRFMKRSFPFAQIYSPHDFFQENIDAVIVEKQYTLILLDANLKNWGMDRVFGNQGVNLIPLIKSKSPNTIIISISDNDDSNKEMLENGVNMAYNKKIFFEEGATKIFAPDLSLKNL